MGYIGSFELVFQDSYSIIPAVELLSQKAVPFLIFLSKYIVLEDLTTVIRQKEEIKGIQTGKEEVKLSLSTDDMRVYIENPIDSTKKLLDLIHKFGKVVGYKSIFRDQRHFCTPTMEYQKQKSGNSHLV